MATQNINVEKLVGFAENAVLGKVGRQSPEALAIARFNPLESYIEERDRTMNKFS